MDLKEIQEALNLIKHYLPAVKSLVETNKKEIGGIVKLGFNVFASIGDEIGEEVDRMGTYYAKRQSYIVKALEDEGFTREEAMILAVARINKLKDLFKNLSLKK